MESRCASAQVHLLRGNTPPPPPPPKTRHDDEIEGSGIETGAVATSDEAEVLSAANETFTASTTAPMKAGSGRFAAGKDRAVGELVGATKETTVD